MKNDPCELTWDQKIILEIIESSLAVQWLRLCASVIGDTGLIPGWGTKMPHGMAKKKKKVETIESSSEMWQVSFLQHFSLALLGFPGGGELAL